MLVVATLMSAPWVPVIIPTARLIPTVPTPLEVTNVTAIQDTLVTPMLGAQRPMNAPLELTIVSLIPSAQTPLAHLPAPVTVDTLGIQQKKASLPTRRKWIALNK